MIKLKDTNFGKKNSLKSVVFDTGFSNTHGNTQFFRISFDQEDITIEQKYIRQSF